MKEEELFSTIYNLILKVCRYDYNHHTLGLGNKSRIIERRDIPIYETIEERSTSFCNQAGVVVKRGGGGLISKILFTINIKIEVIY